MTIGELKKDAKVKLSGSYIKACLITLIYYACIFALSYVVSALSTSPVAIIISIIIAIISVPLSFGIISTFIKIIRNEDVSVLDFITLGFKNFKGVWRTSLRTLVNLLLPLILLIASYIFLFYTLFQAAVASLSQSTVSQDTSSLFLVSIVLVIATAIFYIYKQFSYSLTMYILYDNPTSTGKEINNESVKLMKGNKGKLFLLGLSFIGWMLLVILASTVVSMFLGETAGIIISYLGIILLAPYIIASIVCFYEDLKEDTVSKQEENIEETNKEA